MSVYDLKHATPKMKYQHMNFVLNFREELAEAQAQERERKQQEHDETMEVCEAILNCYPKTQAGRLAYLEWVELGPDGNTEFLEYSKAHLKRLEEWKVEIATCTNCTLAPAMRVCHACDFQLPSSLVTIS